MSRPWRIQFPDARYHVTSRGNNRQPIFLGEPDKQLFLDTLAAAVARFRLHLFAFCLMDNHFHLLVQTPEANLSQAMKWLNATYTCRFHRRHRRSGHLFQGRYRAVLVQDEAHWSHLSIYLHLNPVRAGVVEDPAEYEWSSFRDYTRGRSRFPWLRTEEVLSDYGPSGPAQRRRYRRECLALAGQTPADWEEFRSAVVLGSREVIAELAAKYRPSGQAKTVHSFVQCTRREPDWPLEVARVAKAFQVRSEDLLRRRRNFPPRLALYYHLIEQGGIGPTPVGAKLGVSPMAASQGAKQFQRLMKWDPKLRKIMEALKFKI
jgi:REP element-mobilizing transposase RayT